MEDDRRVVKFTVCKVEETRRMTHLKTISSNFRGSSPLRYFRLLLYSLVYRDRLVHIDLYVQLQSRDQAESRMLFRLPLFWF
jgi:hypothetical protein